MALFEWQEDFYYRHTMPDTAELIEVSRRFSKLVGGLMLDNPDEVMIGDDGQGLLVLSPTEHKSVAEEIILVRGTPVVEPPDASLIICQTVVSPRLDLSGYEKVKALLLRTDSVMDDIHEAIDLEANLAETIVMGYNGQPVGMMEMEGLINYANQTRPFPP